jgi:hypothetical protein
LHPATVAASVRARLEELGLLEPSLALECDVQRG